MFVTVGIRRFQLGRALLEAVAAPPEVARRSVVPVRDDERRRVELDPTDRRSRSDSPSAFARGAPVPADSRRPARRHPRTHDDCGAEFSPQPPRDERLDAPPPPALRHPPSGIRAPLSHCLPIVGVPSSSTGATSAWVGPCSARSARSRQPSSTSQLQNRCTFGRASPRRPRSSDRGRVKTSPRCG